MIYHNGNKINKAYYGGDVVNEIDRYDESTIKAFQYIVSDEPTPPPPTPIVPEGYTEVEWVGSTSSKNSSFDTLIAVGDVVGNSFSIEGKMWTQVQSDGSYLISNEWVKSPYPNFKWKWIGNNVLALSCADGGYSDVSLSSTDLGNGLSSFTISSSSIALGCPKTVSFFCGNRSNSNDTTFNPWRYGYGKLYGDTKITKNGVVVSNLIPCKRDSDSKYGFYCSVRETFLTGTNLVGGDPVE